MKQGLILRWKGSFGLMCRLWIERTPSQLPYSCWTSLRAGNSVHPSDGDLEDLSPSGARSLISIFPYFESKYAKWLGALPLVPASGIGFSASDSDQGRGIGRAWTVPLWAVERVEVDGLHAVAIAPIGMQAFLYAIRFWEGPSLRGALAWDAKLLRKHIFFTEVYEPWGVHTLLLNAYIYNTHMHIVYFNTLYTFHTGRRGVKFLRVKADSNVVHARRFVKDCIRVLFFPVVEVFSTG